MKTAGSVFCALFRVTVKFYLPPLSCSGSRNLRELIWFDLKPQYSLVPVCGLHIENCQVPKSSVECQICNCVHLLFDQTVSDLTHNFTNLLSHIFCMAARV